MRKDKEKVTDEVWTESRVKSFLQVRSHDAVAQDFHMLLKAYQSMRAEDFAKFVGFFLGDGRNINCCNPDGQTVLSIVQQHRNSSEYGSILAQAGAS
jgi:hypothetical protein